MKLHLHGNGAAKTPTIEEDLQQFRAAGFDVVEHFDYMEWGQKLYVGTTRWWCLGFDCRGGGPPRF